MKSLLTLFSNTAYIQHADGEMMTIIYRKLNEFSPLMRGTVYLNGRSDSTLLNMNYMLKRTYFVNSKYRCIFVF